MDLRNVTDRSTVVLVLDLHNVTDRSAVVLVLDLHNVTDRSTVVLVLDLHNVTDRSTVVLVLDLHNVTGWKLESGTDCSLGLSTQTVFLTYATVSAHTLWETSERQEWGA